MPTIEYSTLSDVGEVRRPHTSYLICATNRSGSSLLCEILDSTGLAGQPTEHFCSVYASVAFEQWGCSTIADYVTAVIREGTTPNGVFGSKVMWPDLLQLVGELKDTVPEYADLPMPKVLATAFPNLHYIWLSRRDKVRQAVSLYKADQTDSWMWTGDEPPPETDLAFDFQAIDRELHELVAEDAAWRQYFEQWTITPFGVVYEDFVRVQEATAVNILRFLGIRVPEPLEFGERRLKRQADAHSEEWVRRYRALKRFDDHHRFP